MDLQIKDLRVLVTAGANGIGRATARAFAAEGAKVHICDVDRTALAEMEESDPAMTQSVCDVSDRAAVGRLMDETLAALGGLDCLVNNAGIAGPTGRVDEIDPADWDSCVAIDLTGQFNCTRLAVQHLKQSTNASIINLSSQAGKHGFPLRSPYAAAKWGVIGFTKALSAELGEFGIRANAICPGLVEGPRIQSVIANKARSFNVSHEEMTQRLFSGVSIKQFVDPADIAKQIVFLASPFAKTISGQEISVCGDTRMLA
ncbi:SDR family oxidoreductase [Bosea sp. 124]|uniref:SDR family oxidoreductase n=1 Tax=Bosea sp. 124 TaxID=2135642 RepID=UPI000D3A3552|nr:SDR family oxidoreductase [Bosea sp. 124]PTM43344.1 NAD(P)-dependent dehydrogenase (short-subunit alcohol dehydrogenase family) [Bosea sp. 124]